MNTIGHFENCGVCHSVWSGECSNERCPHIIRHDGPDIGVLGLARELGPPRHSRRMKDLDPEDPKAPDGYRRTRSEIGGVEFPVLEKVEPSPTISGSEEGEVRLGDIYGKPIDGHNPRELLDPSDWASGRTDEPSPVEVVNLDEWNAIKSTLAEANRTIASYEKREPELEVLLAAHKNRADVLKGELDRANEKVATLTRQLGRRLDTRRSGRRY